MGTMLPKITLEVCAIEATRDTETCSDGTVIGGAITYEARFAAGGYAVIDKAEYERLSSEFTF